MPCSKRMLSCRRDCQHRALVKEFYDIHDAWEKLREKGDCMRMEEDEFRERYPEPRFKDFLIARQSRSRFIPSDGD